MANSHSQSPNSASLSRRARAGIARRFINPGRGHVRPELEPVVAIHRKIHPKADLALLERAYAKAEELHDGVMRKSGDPYITHPLAVASIAAEIGMDTTTLVAALMHDTVEDTGYSLDDLTKEFGPDVARIVDGVTKLESVDYGAGAEAETVRKMIVAMSQDPRVLVIKVADRLHNMRTMRFLPPQKQAKKAKETLEVIAPLAHRLGMASVKWELEDLAFAILYPKKYEEVVRLVADRAPERDEYLNRMSSTLRQALKDAGITAMVASRPKHYWSIYQKMIVRGRQFDEIHDLVGVRVLADSEKDCYGALGVVHSLWNPMAGRFKDYIAAPRFGVYSSLHTTVLTSGSKALEVQIRTHEMHEKAEFGIAAHWRYKETKGTHSGTDQELDQIKWMRQLMQWQRETEDASELLEAVRHDFAAKEILVLTPKGDPMSLPEGSTPVDFAYAVHTEVGNRCIGAKVNGKLVALETPLRTSDKVEIFTSKDENAGPSRDWMEFVKSTRARQKIRQWFAKERREDSIEAGRDEIAKVAGRDGMPMHRLFTAELMMQVAHELGYQDVDALYNAVGEKHVPAATVLRHLMEQLGGQDEAENQLATRSSLSAIATTKSRRDWGNAGVVIGDQSGIMAKLANCCTPVKGDEVFGYVTRGGGVSVHRRDCTNAAELLRDGERIVDVTWDKETRSVYPVTVQIEALDRHALLSDVSRKLADEHVAVTAASSHIAEERVAMLRFTFELADNTHLSHILNVLRNIEGVFDVYRVNHSEVGQLN